MKKMCLDGANPFPPPVWSFIELLNVNFVFPLNLFWSNLSNSWARSIVSKFLGGVSSSPCSTQLLCSEFFVLTLVDDWFFFSLIHHCYSYRNSKTKNFEKKSRVKWCGETTPISNDRPSPLNLTRFVQISSKVNIELCFKHSTNSN
jgi:hypothetical protein